MSEKTPVAAQVADGAGQEGVGGDEAAAEVVVADVVALEVELGLGAVDVDLGLEGGDEGEATGG